MRCSAVLCGADAGFIFYDALPTESGATRTNQLGVRFVDLAGRHAIEELPNPPPPQRQRNKEPVRPEEEFEGGD